MKLHPVSFDVTKPARFERIHVVIRILVLIALGMLGASIGWSWVLLYILLPAFAGAAIAAKGSERFLAEDAGSLTTLLRWVLAAYAYLALLTDAPPDRNFAANVRFEVQPGGAPTKGSALLRLLTTLPAAIFLVLLSIISAIVWIVAMLLVAISADYPASMHRLQVGIYRFQARLLAYHASLVDEYPPFSLEEHVPQGPDLTERPA